MNEELPVDRLVVPTLKRVARDTPYFTRREVVHAILRQRDLAVDVREIRRLFPGQQFDAMVMRYIEDAVRRALHARDESGLRIYECYSVGTGERRWMRFRSMRAVEVRQALADTTALRDRLVAKVQLLEAVLAELDRAGQDATVDAIYDTLVRRQDLVVADI